MEAGTFVEDKSIIADEGALLWSVRWSKNDIVGEIAGRYVNTCHSLGIDAVMFDGYKPSTKDKSRHCIYRSAALVVDVSMSKCSSDSSEFLNSASNEKSFSSFLGNITKYEGIKLLLCDNCQKSDI